LADKLLLGISISAKPILIMANLEERYWMLRLLDGA